MDLPANPTQRLGATFIVVGLALLLFRLFSWAFDWPLFILLPGAALLAAAALGGRSASALFIPGSIVTAVGLILLVQNATDRFESWAYAWALIPAAVGVGLMLHGGRTDNPELVRQGRRQARGFAAVFGVAAMFFEAFIFGDLFGSWFFRTALPLLLMAAGAFLLLRERGGGSPEA